MMNVNILNNTNFRSKLERSKNIVKLIEFIWVSLDCGFGLSSE